MEWNHIPLFAVWLAVMGWNQIYLNMPLQKVLFTNTYLTLLKKKLMTLFP